MRVIASSTLALALAVAGCSSGVEVSAKTSELATKHSKISELEEFELLMQKEKFECITYRCDEDCLVQFSKLAPDQELTDLPTKYQVCWWTEDPAPFQIVYGSIRAIVYYNESNVNFVEFKDIYTGP